jgi:hypothetical protein
VSTSRKTCEIVSDLRDAAAVFFSEGQTSKDPDEHFAYLAHVKTLREAADRLEKASMISAFDFTPPMVNTGNIRAMFRAGIEAYRDAIADGSIDEMVKK